MKHTYIVKGAGRKIGAIGKFYTVVFSVLAESEDAARERAYAEHEWRSPPTIRRRDS